MERMTGGPLLLAADVSPLADAALYAAAWGLVSARRREKAQRFRFEKDRRLSLGAELLLRCALREAGLATETESIRTDDNGKPFFMDGRCSFSLSHSGSWALCAVAGFELGCDMEELRPVDLKLARRFCPQECADILAQPSEAERQLLFYRYWTLKESYMKATGLGLALPPDGFCIRLGQRITVSRAGVEQPYRFREFSEIPGCCCAVCGAGECGGAVLRTVDLAELLHGAGGPCGKA